MRHDRYVVMKPPMSGPTAAAIAADAPTNAGVFYGSINATIDGGLHSLVVRGVDGGSAFQTLLDLPFSVNSVTLSPDGRRVAIGGEAANSAPDRPPGVAPVPPATVPPCP